MNILSLITLYYGITLGGTNNDFQLYQPNELTTSHRLSSNTGYSKFEASIEIWRFNLDGSLHTSVMKAESDSYDFRPLKAVYDWRLSYNWKGFSIGYSHTCVHPIMPYLPESAIKWKLDGAVREVSISWHGSFNLGGKK